MSDLVRYSDGALLSVPGLGKARVCMAAKSHSPRPLRFVWHHVLPETCGGATDQTNLISVCDSCHLSIHALLYYMATHNGVLPTRVGAVKQRDFARMGYAMASEFSVINKIPNEGSILL